MSYAADMRYLGQAHEVAVEVPEDWVRTIDKDTLRRLEGLFHEKHERLFGHSSRDSDVEFITLTVAATGPLARSETPGIAQGTADPREAFKGRRKAYFPELGGYVDVPTYERSRLKAGNVVAGAAIVEQMDTTIVLPPGQIGKVDQWGNIIVDIST